MPETLQVLVTMPFTDAQLDRLRAVSPRLTVDRADAATADYARTSVLYAGAPPRDLARAPALRWVQVHMAGVNSLYDHPLYTQSTLPITTSERRACGGHRGVRDHHAARARASRAPDGGVAPDRRLAARPRAVAAVRAERGPRRHARHHRLREHRAGAGADRQDRLRDDDPRLQAGSVAACRFRVRAAGDRRSRGAPARRVVRSGDSCRPARARRRRRDGRAADARDGRPDGRARVRRHEAVAPTSSTSAVAPRSTRRRWPGRWPSAASRARPWTCSRRSRRRRDIRSMRWRRRRAPRS